MVNPFRISRDFLREKGFREVYQYGETPLTSMELIAKECGIGKMDFVYELGSGRGRGALWLRFFIGCRVLGIDFVPYFITVAQKVKERYAIKGIEFLCSDILRADYSGATVVYYYGTMVDEEFLRKLTARFKKLPKGAKIITVSYPLDAYSFKVSKKFQVTFTWGEADVYLHIV